MRKFCDRNEELAIRISIIIALYGAVTVGIFYGGNFCGEIWGMT